jgi:hypothetical protein
LRDPDLLLPRGGRLFELMLNPEAGMASMIFMLPAGDRF